MTDRPRISARRALALAAPEPENTRTRIIDAAIRLLGEGGYAALSISTICRQAEIAAPSLYWHFGDKAGLMAAMVRHVQRLDANTFLEELVEARSTRARIETGLRTLRRMVLSDPFNTWVVTAALWQGRHQAEQIPALVNEARRRQVEFFRRTAVEYYDLAATDTLAYTTAAFCEYAALSYHRSKSERDLDRILDALRANWQLATTWLKLPAELRREVELTSAAIDIELSNLDGALP